MSFLNGNNSDFLSARITKRGRNSIAKGDFKISYFQVGDSEFDYSSPFNSMDGQQSNPYQKVFAPFDNEAGVKYPYKLDNTDTSTTYGVPVENSYSEPLRNVMGPAGFVNRFKEFDDINCDGTIVKCHTETIQINTQINGGKTITVLDGTEYTDCEYVTIVLGEFSCTDPTITGNSTSLIYKIESVSGNTLTLDRNLPDLSTVNSVGQIICNKCKNEDPFICLQQTNPEDQLDPWTLNVVWSEYPIGYSGITNSELTGFTSNKHISTKQFLGYTTSSGQTINTGTTYTNSYGDTIIITPEEQRCIAIIHFSELGTINDPERFFKYDDYISTNNDVDESIYQDSDGIDLTDLEYFEVFIPFILYHRNTGNTIGAKFTMDTVDQTITTPTNIVDGRMSLKFRYLLDEQGNKVGKVFYNNKIIVFDDQELVALLDYKSNRRYTLDAPKVFLVPSDTTISNSLISGDTQQTFWVTYTFTNSDYSLNGLPCNYYTKITNSVNTDNCVLNIPSNIAVKFSTDSFRYMVSSLGATLTGFVGTDFKILVQETEVGEYPKPEYWKEIDFTTEANGDGITFLNPTNLKDVTFIINKTDYENAPYYVLETYFASNPFVGNDKFGDEQPFPGSVSVVRATDLQVMNFLINLPSSQFTETQNPTYVNGKEKKITDITLLNNNKEVVAVAKTSVPLTRVGSQVIAVKLDF